jgi:HEPN superfamily RiboL-PSP-like protein
MVQIMTAKYTKKQSLIDLETLLDNCLEDIRAINETLNFVPDTHIQIQRYMCVAMAYAEWERFFRQSHGICLKLVRSVFQKNDLCPEALQPLWFRKSDEYKFLVQFINTDRKLESEAGERETKSPYEFAFRLLQHSKNWLSSELDHRDIDGLTITLSNVDKKVVEFNAKILGIDQYREFQCLDLGKLNSLVGRRNDVAHGGLVTSIGRREISEALHFAESHCRLYYTVVKKWIVKLKMRP